MFMRWLCFCGGKFSLLSSTFMAKLIHRFIKSQNHQHQSQIWLQVPNLNCRVNHLAEEGTDQVRTILCSKLSRKVKLIFVLYVQVKLVLTLKTVKEKLVREKLEVGGGNLTTVNLEVLPFLMMILEGKIFQLSTWRF